MFVSGAALLSGLAVLCSVPIASPSSPESDLKEVSTYKLTVPVLKQVVLATRNLVAAMPSDPRFQRAQKLKAEMAAMSAAMEKGEPTEADVEKIQKIGQEIEAIEGSLNIMGGQKSLDEIEAAALREPLVGKAMKAAGLSAREYAKFMAALLQASMIAGFQKEGMLKTVPKEANLENVKFVEQHAAELAAFMKEMEALSQKEP